MFVDARGPHLDLLHAGVSWLHPNLCALPSVGLRSRSACLLRMQKSPRFPAVRSPFFLSVSDFVPMFVVARRPHLGLFHAEVFWLRPDSCALPSVGLRAQSACLIRMRKSPKFSVVCPLRIVILVG